MLLKTCRDLFRSEPNLEFLSKLFYSQTILMINRYVKGKRQLKNIN